LTEEERPFTQGRSWLGAPPARIFLWCAVASLISCTGLGVVAALTARTLSAVWSIVGWLLVNRAIVYLFLPSVPLAALVACFDLSRIDRQAWRALRSVALVAVGCATLEVIIFACARWTKRSFEFVVTSEALLLAIAWIVFNALLCRWALKHRMLGGKRRTALAVTGMVGFAALVMYACLGPADFPWWYALDFLRFRAVANSFW
jgi:FlaA1/EpsC-like NDP-sugar epimerase